MKSIELTNPEIAPALLKSARLYEEKWRWHISIFLLMPTHLHALLSFCNDKAMRDVIGDWKRFHARNNDIRWQDGFFDHRLRDDERGEQLSLKMDYIRQNPVASGLCQKASDWPWVHPTPDV